MIRARMLVTNVYFAFSLMRRKCTVVHYCNVTLQLLQTIVAHIIVIMKTHRAAWCNTISNLLR